MWKIVRQLSNKTAIWIRARRPENARYVRTCFARANQLDEARRAFETTIWLAESNPALFEQYEKLARAQLRRLQR